MARYRTLTPLPSEGYPHARARWLAEQAGAVVWRTASAEVVESRETWPDGTTGLSNTPGNPEGSGWVRLTPT